MPWGNVAGEGGFGRPELGVRRPWKQPGKILDRNPGKSIDKAVLPDYNQIIDFSVHEQPRFNSHKGDTFMVKHIRQRDWYAGFEQGTIRPAGEDRSLALRLTRGCAWKRCVFCRMYEKESFSVRSVDNVFQDIDLIRTYLDRIRMIVKPGGRPDTEVIQTLYNSFEVKDRIAFNAAMDWHETGARTITLQDMDPLVMDPLELVRILEHVRSAFPQVNRITTTTQSRTLARMQPKALDALARAGLSRIHLGLESGSNRILTRSRIGATRETHIRVGSMVKEAGIELSVYVVPGLGGVELSVEHALETAAVLNRIDPHVIRFRSLAVPPVTLLAHEVERNQFEPPTDVMMVKEIRLILDSLMGVTSRVSSDSSLNLLEEIRGLLPQDQEKMIAVIDHFLELPAQEQVHFMVGRRMGYFNQLDDMKPGFELDEVKKSCLAFGITPENVDIVIDEMKKHFV